MKNTCALASSLAVALTMLVGSSAVWAQSPPAAPANNADSAALFPAPLDDEKPTTATFLGDTGIWYVPTAEILGNGTWSIAGDHRGTNYVQGFSNVADFAGSMARGFGSRVEVFGSFLFDTRIKRNDAPIFYGDYGQGGIVARYPRVAQTWTGNKIGDLSLGSKINLLSQYHSAPMALAVRGIVKLPTADDGAGVGTGRTDVMADLIASKEIRRFLEVAAFGGYEIRGNPDGFDAPDGSYRWGTGLTFPTRSPLRFSAEVNGDLPTNYTATLRDSFPVGADPVVGTDGTQPSYRSGIRNCLRATGGLTFQAPAGFFIGGGLSWNAPRYWDIQVRVGYHGRGQILPRSYSRAAVPPPAPAATMPAPPPPPTPAPRTDPPVAAAIALPPAAPKTYTFEDVYFEFDGYTPRAVAIAVLDEAVATLAANPTLNISVEGHTCNIGTSEYNLALGERRALAVRDYLVSHGVSTGRMRTASYGEDNPEHANAHEVTRHLNHRVAMVVRREP